ncbi:MAG: SUMF1/EgtB/PvdO family nonheme iron enzyme [Cocleimonas sp.]
MNTKQNLIKAFKNTHQKITALINTLNADELDIPFHPGVNPPIWEIGHAAFFYEEFILKALDGEQKSYDPAMDDTWDSFQIDHKDRWLSGAIPSLKKTLEYVNHIFNAVLTRIEDNELTDADLYFYKYAIFHQNMHIESLIWARQTSGFSKMLFDSFQIKELPEADTEINPSSDAEIPSGKYLIGMPADSKQFPQNDFAFDNEKPWFEVELESFNISKTLVSNKEFLAFVNDGGYQNEKHWSFAGKKWLKTKRNTAIPPEEKMQLPAHPIYWLYEDGQWTERLFDQWKPLVDEYPVTHVSFWEVEAYCNWAGRRLPTEYEWEVAALGNRKGQAIRYFPWGNNMDANKVDMDGELMAQVPVTAYPEGDSVFGCRQMLGTVWEWTSSQYLPYDGFTMDMYVYMSTLQFGYHKTTKGGSCATSSILIRGSYRQAYFPTRTDVYVGFRTCAL